jgi:hypothetical protein
MSAPYEGDSNSPNMPGLSGMQASVPGIGVYGQSVHGSSVQALELPAPGSNASEIDFHSAVHKAILQGVGVLGSTSQSGANGVAGLSDNGWGVLGASRVSSGVEGMSPYFDAIVGVTYSDAHAGVTGRNMTSGANGGVGIYGTGGQYAGKFDGAVTVTDTQDEDAFVSTSGSKDHAAVAAHNNNGGTAFWGLSASPGGTGIYAKGAKWAAQFDGAVQVNGNIDMGGGDVVFSDCAEQFDVSADTIAEPGTVMVIADEGGLEPSSMAYDKRAAGVVSGAGDFRPGIILGAMPQSRRSRVPVALVGKAYCKVDAGDAPIEVGDMLTTSPTVGHAMKACDPARAFGAVIGKALRPLATGTGLIPILIALQ